MVSDMADKNVLNRPSKPSFSRAGADGFTFPIQNPRIEVDYIESHTGHEGVVVSDSLSHLYYILHGEGKFILDGSEHLVTKGQLIEIPPGVSFDYVGKMEMLLIMEPPFSPEKIREL